MDTEGDREVVARQLGREPRAFRRVVVRCPFGRPAVTEQQPYTPDGEPFPTTYYVTCRHLVAAVSRLEADGGVERWSARVDAEPALADSRAGADAEQRRIRHELAAAYGDADAWARQAVADRAPGPGWPRDLALVLAAAFHAYQRGASDFGS